MTGKHLISILIISCFILGCKEETELLYSTPKGKDLTEQVNDQLQFHLNDGSTIYTDVKKSDHYTLQGELYIQNSSADPITIKTKYGTVRLEKGRYNLRTWDECLQLKCFQGKIRVLKPDLNILLTNDHALKILPSGETVELERAFYDQPFWTLKNSTSKMEKVTLKHICKEIERQFDVRVIAPESDNQYTVRFPNMLLEKAVRDVCNITELQFDLDLENRKVSIHEN